jgi:hypothetical protein
MEERERRKKKKVQLQGWRFEHTNLTTAHTNSGRELISSLTNYQQTNQKQCGRKKYLGAH